ncbi:MAG: type III pantothenate kinase [bacterium]
MLLAIDIGNTHIVSGVFDGDKLKATSRLATDAGKTTDEYGALLTNILAIKAGTDEKGGDLITGVALSSVVPVLTGTFRDLCKTYFHVEPLVVEPGIKTELAIKYPNPRSIGADRIVNAVAASFLYPPPPLIIIDFGTAVTFCAVTRDKEYIGGTIFPGMRASFSALARGTALLSMVEFKKPPGVIGKSTEESLQSGAIFGYACLVEGMVEKFKTEIGEDATIIGTGGMVELVMQATEIIDHIEPHLTLKGLKIIHNLNKT